MPLQWEGAPPPFHSGRGLPISQWEGLPISVGGGSPISQWEGAPPFPQWWAQEAPSNAGWCKAPGKTVSEALEEGW